MANLPPDIHNGMALGPQSVQNLAQIGNVAPLCYLTEPSANGGQQFSSSTAVTPHSPWLSQQVSPLETNFSTSPHYAANIFNQLPSTVTNESTVSWSLTPDPLNVYGELPSAKHLPFKKRAHAERLATTSKVSLSSEISGFEMDCLASRGPQLELRHVKHGSNRGPVPDHHRLANQTTRFSSPSSVILEKPYWNPALPLDSLTASHQNLITSPSHRLNTLNLSTRHNVCAANENFSELERDYTFKEPRPEMNVLDSKNLNMPFVNWGSQETEHFLWVKLKAVKADSKQIQDIFNNLRDEIEVINGRALLNLEPAKWLRISPEFGERLFNIMAKAGNQHEVQKLPLICWGPPETERLLWISLRAIKVDSMEIEDIVNKLRAEVGQQQLDGKALLCLEPAQWVKISPKYGVQLFNIVANAAHPDSTRRQEADDVFRKPAPRPRKRRDQCVGQLWEFIIQKLKDPSTNPSVIQWEDESRKLFRIIDTEKIARLWGEHKGNKKMTYANMSRTMRYYDKGKGAFVPDDRKRVYGFGPKAKVDDLLAKLAKS